ncbi:MAG TPA: CUAEP/CCAEP-tail radical SAM protein [Candidatus Acidoferrum sp.]|nr:CUAEP/CCAEP-tail radical SAM protein [Candidatus Acidoferrum sp.]
MKIVLISTYELGRQPFGLVSPAGWLRRRGHEVACFDLSRQELDAGAVRAAELVAIYLPMHTATRLGCKLIPTLREKNAGAHICCYGLYAPMNAEYLRLLGVGTILGGEFEDGLVRLAERLSKARPERLASAQVGASEQSPQILHAEPSRGAACCAPTFTGQSEPMISLERLRFEVPDRAGLAPLAKYAHLILPGGGYRVVGSTEASRGCKHLCRHCPIVPVYNGVFRIVARDVVLADVRQQVAAGAQHISFGDPDFFNGIRHAMELVEAFHAEFPRVTYDVTIKIEHLRKYERDLARLRDTGCLFVISAVESVDDGILERLDKGHTREDFLYVSRKFRELGMTLHPTFVPFTLWTTLGGYLDLLRVLAAEELVENVAPIQLGIRLLIPEGSRLLELEDVRAGVGAFDAESLVYPWKNSDARVDLLSETVQGIAAAADRKKESRGVAFTRIWEAAHWVAEIAAPVLRVKEGRGVPFLSEPWYCCAEPTRDQLVAIGGAAAAPAETAEKVVIADGFV